MYWGQKLVQVTIPLPLPAQAGAVSRQLLVSTEGGASHVYGVGVGDATKVIDVAQNAKVHVELADLDKDGNLGVSTVLDFVAVTAPPLAAPAALAAPTVIVAPQFVPSPGIGQPRL